MGQKQCHMSLAANKAGKFSWIQSDSSQGSIAKEGGVEYWLKEQYLLQSLIYSYKDQ